MKVFAIHGFFAGIVAILFATQLSVIQSTVPPNLELTIITASVVGGVSILGGIGTVVGSTLAAVLLAEIASALIFINVSPYWLRAVQGVLILVTVLADILRRRRRARGALTMAVTDVPAAPQSVPSTSRTRRCSRIILVVARRRARAFHRPVPHGRQPPQPGPADDRGRR